MNKSQEERRRAICRFMVARGHDPMEALKDAAYLMRQNHALRSIGVRLCSENMSEEEKERLQKRERNICKRCEEVAGRYGCRFFYQSDPRGAAVFLMPEEVINSHREEIKRWGSEEAWLESCFYPLAQSFEYL